MKTTRLLYLVAILAITSLISAQSREMIVAASYYVGGPEQLSYGPSALRIAPNGTFWIVNAADNTLTNIDRNGAKLGQIGLQGEAVGVTDVQFSEYGVLTVMDGSAAPPALLTLASDGTVQQRKELHRAFGPGQRRGIGATSDATDEPPFAALSFEAAGVVPFDSWHIRAGTDSDPTAVLTKDATRIEVRASRGVMRGLRILGETAQAVFVLAEEVADGDPILVDLTARKYSRRGELLGIARIPLDDRYTHVETPAALSADGEVWILRTQPGVAVISYLALARTIPDVLPEPRDRFIANSTFDYTANAATITRDQMEANARAFLNNSTYYNQNALTGACAGRTAPRHLGRTPRTIGSVAYDWGGFDSVADYNRFIAAGHSAGDIDTRAVESCSKGVDCSGYVSRVWGLTSKKSTCSLADVSHVITTQSLLKGDALTRCNDHVVLFESFSSTGVWAYESTLYNSMDRVVYIHSSWSRLNGYTPRRYNNVATEPTTPVHMSSGASPMAGAPGMIATISSTWKNADATNMTARLTVRTPWGSTYDYTMPFVSGQTASGATFQLRVNLGSVGRWDYAVTVTSTVSGKWSRYPSSGFAAGPTVTSTSWSVTPSTYVCNQYPATIRVGAYLASAQNVRFSVTKSNNWCGYNGSFIANGVVDIRQDSIYGPIVASTSYYAGAPEVLVNFIPNFTFGSRRYYATIRNQGYWAGPVTITAR